MENNIKLFEERFIETITDKETEKYSYGSFNNCPYCGGELDSNLKTMDRKYKRVDLETRKNNGVYLKCRHCHLSFVEYTPVHVPYFNISLSVLLKIVFAPHLSLYRLNDITNVGRSSIKKIRTKYKKLSDLLCGFLEAYKINTFTEFEDYYENEVALKTYEDIMGVTMPTRENGLNWYYNNIEIKKNK